MLKIRKSIGMIDNPNKYFLYASSTNRSERLFVALNKIIRLVLKMEYHTHLAKERVRSTYADCTNALFN